MDSCCGVTWNGVVFVFGILIVRQLGDGDFLRGYFGIGIEQVDLYMQMINY